MITCDRCEKILTRTQIFEMDAGKYIACEDCAAEFLQGKRKIDGELDELREQRVGSWYNEWKRNKPRQKE